MMSLDSVPLLTHLMVPVMPAVNVLVAGGRGQGGLWRVGLVISAGVEHHRGQRTVEGSTSIVTKGEVG